MHIGNAITRGLILTGLCTLGTLAPRPAAAQNLVYTLSGVTFADGAVATGYFTFNPATQTAGNYDIITTNGLTDTLTGAEYTPASVPPGAISPQVIEDFAFGFATNNTFNLLSLTADSHITAAGTYGLLPGTVTSPEAILDSGEFVPPPPGEFLLIPRVITTGSLVVTNAAPVPEASTTISLSLLLVFGLGVVVITAKRKKQA